MDFLATLRHIWVGHLSRSGSSARARDQGMVSAQRWAEGQSYAMPRSKSASAKFMAARDAAASQNSRGSVADDDTRLISEVVL